MIKKKLQGKEEDDGGREEEERKNKREKQGRWEGEKRRHNFEISGKGGPLKKNQ